MVGATATQTATSFATLMKRLIAAEIARLGDHPVGGAALLDALGEFGGDVGCGAEGVTACEVEVVEGEVERDGVVDVPAAVIETGVVVC